MVWRAMHAVYMTELYLLSSCPILLLLNAHISTTIWYTPIFRSCLTDWTLSDVFAYATFGDAWSHVPQLRTLSLLLSCRRVRSDALSLALAFCERLSVARLSLSSLQRGQRRRSGVIRISVPSILI